MDSLPALAREAGHPMEVVPPWMAAEGRPMFADTLPLSRLRGMARTAEELRGCVAARSVQEEYAVRCRRQTKAFLEFLLRRDRGMKVSTGTELANFGAHLLRERESIGRSTTIRKYLVEASRCWPSALHEGVVTEFLRGLETLSPALPEAAGIALERTFVPEDVEQWMLKELDLNGGFSVALVTGLVAGLRMREAARLLVRDGDAAFSVSGNIVTWRERASTKTNARGNKFLADRTAWVPPDVAAVLGVLPLPWRAPSRVVADVVARTAAALVEAGIARDVRVFRRGLAVRMREELVNDGESESQAVAVVRDALGHKPGSLTTFRYLGSKLSAKGADRMKKVQGKVQRGVRTGA